MRADLCLVPLVPPLFLKHQKRLCGWLVISKRGHGVPAHAVISETHPHVTEIHGNLLKNAMEGLLYVNRPFCLKGHNQAKHGMHKEICVHNVLILPLNEYSVKVLLTYL